VADDYEVFNSWVKRRVIAIALTEYTFICSTKEVRKEVILKHLIKIE